MSIVIDLILIAILAVSALLAYKKGLIGTLFSLVGTVLAIVLSVALSSSVAGIINTNFVNPAVKSYILSAVDSSAAGQSYDQAIASIDVASAVEKMPDALKDILELANIDTNEIIRRANALTENSQNAKDELINSIAAPISGTISRVIALIVLFIVLSIIMWVAVKLITAVFKMLPLGKTVNKVGGLAFGILRGLIIVFAISTVFTALSHGVDPKSDNIFSKSTINSTVVLKTLADINPINAVLGIN